ncbi:MAG: hypothetical protein D6768_19105, partial [Chloroflexi bacterium]
KLGALAGFLVALLDGKPLEQCLLFAREVVELKLQTVGTLESALDRQALYEKMPAPDTAIRPYPTPADK